SCSSATAKGSPSAVTWRCRKRPRRSKWRQRHNVATSIADGARRCLLTLLLATLLGVPLLYCADPWQTRGLKPLILAMMAGAPSRLALVQVRVAADLRPLRAFLRTGANLPVLLLVLYGGISWYRSPVAGMSAVEWWRLASGAALYFVVG